jgi:hypothetical protein
MGGDNLNASRLNGFYELRLENFLLIDLFFIYLFSQKMLISIALFIKMCYFSKKVLKKIDCISLKKHPKEKSSFLDLTVGHCRRELG